MSYFLSTCLNDLGNTIVNSLVLLSGRSVKARQQYDAHIFGKIAILGTIHPSSRVAAD